MLSEHANKIIKDIDKVRKKKMNIDYLLQKYNEKPERDFIQKYAETQIAIVGVSAYWLSLMVFSISIAFTIALFLWGDQMKAGVNTYSLVFIIFIVAYILALFNFSVKVFKGDILEKIIIEIEDINMQSNMETSPTTISKLEQLSNFCKKLIKLI